MPSVERGSDVSTGLSEVIGSWNTMAISRRGPRQLVLAQASSRDPETGRAPDSPAGMARGP